jgi:O-antigen/teichoic acid export membrane protein
MPRATALRSPRLGTGRLEPAAIGVAGPGSGNMQTVRRSLLYSLAATYGATLIGLGSSMILARLLTPGQIGVFSVTASLVMIAHALREFGMGSYLVQERELTRARLQTAFGVALLIAWPIAMAIFFAREALADFYREPGIRSILGILAINFAMIPFGSVNMSLLGRDMRFDLLLRIELISLLAHALTATLLAWHGYGFMSLAWATLVGTATTVGLSIYYRSVEIPWLPSLAEWRRVAGRSSLFSASAILSKIELSAPDLFIGRVLGFTSVGLFSRATGLFAMFGDKLVRSVRLVVETDLARRHRADASVIRAYLKAISYLTAISWPLYGFVAVMAAPLIRTLFGPQWDEAAQIVPVIALAAACTTVVELGPSVLTALGEPRRLARAQAWSVATTVGTIAIAAFFGLMAVAWALVIARALRTLVFHRAIAPLVGYSLADLLRTVLPSLAIAAASVAATAGVALTREAEDANRFVDLAIAGAACAAAWTLAVLLTRHPIGKELLPIWRRGLAWAIPGRGQRGL